MITARRGQIVNVGSIFGSIGFPCFASYSASKFALRGFSEALRRELADSGVTVTYVAPRFTRTGFNHGAVARMADALRMNQDEPETVARDVVDAIERDGRNRYFGWPEKFFVRINSRDAATRRSTADAASRADASIRRQRIDRYRFLVR